jgi:CubicO group peptidase (beta-lactamase class C family)
VRSTMHDYANVVQMVAQHGLWNGSQYLSAADIADMQRDQTHGAPVISTPDPFAFGYGYGEWRNLLDAQGNAVQVSSTGKFGTSPWVDNQTGVAAVFLVYSSASLIADDLRDLWNNVRNIVIAEDTIFSDAYGG